jgi:hypothetical protein
VLRVLLKSMVIAAMRQQIQFEIRLDLFAIVVYRLGPLVPEVLIAAAVSVMVPALKAVACVILIFVLLDLEEMNDTKSCSATL